VDQFKCHGFEASSQKTAKQLASHIVSTCNSVFRKLRRTRKQLRKKTVAEGKAAPVTDTKAAPSDDFAARLKAELQAEVEAAKNYRQSLQVALSSLDEEDDDEDDVDAAMMADMDKEMRINYDEFADEFAKISLEISAISDSVDPAKRVLKLTDDDAPPAIEEVDEVGEAMADIALEDSEFELNRSASI